MGFFTKGVTQKLVATWKAACKQYEAALRLKVALNNKKIAQELRIQKFQESVSNWVENKYPGGHDAYEKHREMELAELKKQPEAAKKAFEIVRNAIATLSNENAVVLQLSRAINDQLKVTRAAKDKMEKSRDALQEYVEKKSKVKAELSETDYKAWKKMYENIAKVLK